MKLYWLRVCAIKRGVKKSRKTGLVDQAEIDPFAKFIWANSTEEAIQLATKELGDGEGTEGPRISNKAEEQRMRDLVFPEILGLFSAKHDRDATKIR